MNGAVKEIKVRLEYIPGQKSPKNYIEVKISPNATVSELKTAFEAELKKGDGELILKNPIGLLKFNDENLEDGNKTLQKLGIKDNAVLENENRVFLTTVTGATISVTCNKNTTLRDFLEQSADKIKETKGTTETRFVSFIFAGVQIPRANLGSKLVGLKVQSNNSSISPITYGSLLHAVLVRGKISLDRAFCLDNLDMQGNDLQKAYTKHNKSIDDEFAKLKIIEEDQLNLKENQNEGNQLNDADNSSVRVGSPNHWPLLRWIFGVVSLFLLMGTIISFWLEFHISVPIAFVLLFVGFVVVFFGWNKVLPENWRKTLANIRIRCLSNRQNKSLVNSVIKTEYQQPDKKHNRSGDKLFE